MEHSLLSQLDYANSELKCFQNQLLIVIHQWVLHLEQDTYFMQYFKGRGVGEEAGGSKEAWNILEIFLFCSLDITDIVS